MQNVGNDGVLINAVGDGLAELRILEPRQFLRRNKGRTGLRVHAGIHVEAEERGTERRAALVDREVAVRFQRLQGLILFA